MTLSRDMLPVLLRALYRSLHISSHIHVVPTSSEIPSYKNRIYFTLFMFGIFQAEDGDNRIREVEVYSVSKLVYI